jgi:hypothetical protein
MLLLSNVHRMGLDRHLKVAPKDFYVPYNVESAPFMHLLYVCMSTLIKLVVLNFFLFHDRGCAVIICYRIW